MLAHRRSSNIRLGDLVRMVCRLLSWWYPQKSVISRSFDRLRQITISKAQQQQNLITMPINNCLLNKDYQKWVLTSLLKGLRVLLSVVQVIASQLEQHHGKRFAAATEPSSP